MEIDAAGFVSANCVLTTNLALTSSCRPSKTPATALASVPVSLGASLGPGSFRRQGGRAQRPWPFHRAEAPCCAQLLDQPCERCNTSLS